MCRFVQAGTSGGVAFSRDSRFRIVRQGAHRVGADSIRLKRRAYTGGQQSWPTLFSIMVCVGEGEHGVSRSRIAHEERRCGTLVMFFVFVQGVGQPRAFRLVLVTC